LPHYKIGVDVLPLNISDKKINEDDDCRRPPHSFAYATYAALYSESFHSPVNPHPLEALNDLLSGNSSTSITTRHDSQGSNSDWSTPSSYV
jgi:hypothetical protein